MALESDGPGLNSHPASLYVNILQCVPDSLAALRVVTIFMSYK